MGENNSKYILNLVEELTDSLKSYFEKNSLELITRDQASNYEDIDYIFNRMIFNRVLMLFQ